MNSHLVDSHTYAVIEAAERMSSFRNNNFRPLLSSAPGKVILHGEHAVVHGHAAVAASLGVRSRVHLQPVEGQELVRVDFPDVGCLSRSWSCLDIRKSILDTRPSREELRGGSRRFQVW